MQSFHLEPDTTGGDCAVLRLEGEIDAYAAPQLGDMVAKLAENGAVHIIADLREAGFLDSAGVGALVGSRNVLRARGGSLARVASTGRVLQTIRITGLHEAFPLHSCLIDAITADQHWQAARSSITCQTSLSSWFSFQMPYAVPSSTGGTTTSPIAPLTAASTHS